MGRFLARLIDAQAGWAKPFGDFNRRWLGALLRPVPAIKDFLHGRWLGHPLHAATTDIPIGVLTVVIVLDLLGQPAAADIALVVGIIAMAASALTGATDYADTSGKALMRATVHASLMVVALVLYLVSLALRAGDPADRTVPIALSIVAYGVLTAGAYVGGDVVYALGNMVDRHAFRGAGTKWLPIEVAEVDDLGLLPEHTPVKAKLGINTLLLVRDGTSIHALHDVCAHAGGPLNEGRLVDGCIECPWHQSRFELATGHARRGPTVYDQPRYEVRRGESGWEARRASSG
jgi:nitrite reductase/ring-hydroxylating ferredoxin subunit